MPVIHSLGRLAAITSLISVAVCVLILTGGGARDLMMQGWTSPPPDNLDMITKRDVPDTNTQDDHVVTMAFLWTPPSIFSTPVASASPMKIVVEPSKADIILTASDAISTEPVTVFLTTTVFESSPTMSAQQDVVQAAVLAELRQNLAVPSKYITASTQAVSHVLIQVDSSSTQSQRISSKVNAPSQVLAASIVAPAASRIAMTLDAPAQLLEVSTNQNDQTCQGGCSYLSPSQSPQPITTQFGSVVSPVCSPYLVATFFGQCPFGGNTCSPVVPVTATCTTTVTSCTASVVFTVTNYPLASTVISTVIASNCPLTGANNGGGLSLVLPSSGITSDAITLGSGNSNSPISLATSAFPSIISSSNNANQATIISVFSSTTISSSILASVIVSTNTLSSGAISSLRVSSTSPTTGDSASGTSSQSISNTPTTLASASSSTNPPGSTSSISVGSVSSSSLTISSGSSLLASSLSSSNTLSTSPMQSQASGSATSVLITVLPSSTAGQSNVVPIPVISQLTASPILSAAPLPTTALDDIKSLASSLLGDASSIIGGNALSSIVTEVNSIVGNLPVAGSVVAPLVSDVESLVTGVVGQLTGVAAEVTSIAGGLVNPIISGVGAGAGSIVAPLVSDVTGIVGDVTSIAGGLLDPLTGIAGGLLNPTGGPVAPIVSQVLGSNGLVPVVVSEVTGVVNGATSVVDGLVSEVTVVVGGVTSIANAVLNPVLSDVGSAAGGIVAPVTAIVGGVETLLGGIVNGAGGLAVGLGQGIQGLGGLLIEVSTTSGEPEMAKRTPTAAVASSQQSGVVQVTVTKIFTSTFRG